MGFGAWKGGGWVSCTWESVCSSLDVRNKSASGSSCQVKSSEAVGEGNLRGCGCTTAHRALAGDSRMSPRLPMPHGGDGL